MGFAMFCLFDSPMCYFRVWFCNPLLSCSISSSPRLVDQKDPRIEGAFPCHPMWPYIFIKKTLKKRNSSCNVETRLPCFTVSNCHQFLWIKHDKTVPKKWCRCWRWIPRSTPALQSSQDAQLSRLLQRSWGGAKTSQNGHQKQGLTSPMNTGPRDMMKYEVKIDSIEKHVEDHGCFQGWVGQHSLELNS